MESSVSPPLVSVIMPVYNGEKFVRQSIDSILDQSFSGFEFIILDDGSTDKSLSILRRYEAQDHRIRLISRVNKGLVASLNEMLNLARGAYIVRMDADDISMSKRIEKQLSFMVDNPSVDICGSYIRVFGGFPYTQKFPISSEAIKAGLLFYTPLAHPALMIKASFFKDKKYDEAYQKAEDLQLWASSIRSYECHNIPETLLHYRCHKNQISKVYDTHQANLSAEIREALFNELGFSLTNTELQLHKEIANGQHVDIQAALDLLNKISYQNSYFSAEVLDSQIDYILWKVLGYSSSDGLSVLFKYFELKKNFPFNVSFISKFIFLLKVLFKKNKFLS